jgi:NADPH:quinone reductase-like Zn-dependent oxidoreductase
VAVGEEVSSLAVGDDVFGTGAGAWAHHAIARESKLARKPSGVSFEDAAAAPVAALTALQALRDRGKVAEGSRVLVNGASGGVGAFTVQLARWLGAEVTAVCSSGNVERARSLGARRVIDYTTEDFTRLDERYDVLVDIAGSRPLRRLCRVLTAEATIVLVGARMAYRGLGPLPHLVGTKLSGVFRSQTVTFFVAQINSADLELVGGLLADETIRSAIDRTFSGLEGIEEALLVLGEGHARGKLVITL